MFSLVSVKVVLFILPNDVDLSDFNHIFKKWWWLRIYVTVPLYAIQVEGTWNIHNNAKWKRKHFMFQTIE